MLSSLLAPLHPLLSALFYTALCHGLEVRDAESTESGPWPDTEFLMSNALLIKFKNFTRSFVDPATRPSAHTLSGSSFSQVRNLLNESRSPMRTRRAAVPTSSLRITSEDWNLFSRWIPCQAIFRQLYFVIIPPQHPYFPLISFIFIPCQEH